MNLTINHAHVGQLPFAPALRPVEWVTLSDFLNRHGLAHEAVESMIRAGRLAWKIAPTARYSRPYLLINAASYVP